ncbi:MAG: Gfo/Idh/MocA family oxidoreductase [Prevotellaceae bacterium]|nr:Gfo/Idh/MocA family oxidoreductase [Candidatus Minthosoma equi]
MEHLKTVRWGFIGCGEVTEKKSGPAFGMIAGSEVVAVMSRDIHKAESYAKRNGIKKYYSDAQLLVDDPEVNAVYIATPPSSHATFAVMAMKAGKPAYIEKPLAASYIDCLRVNRISELTGVPCFVAFYRRYLPYFEKVKEIVSSGQIGKILTVQIRFAVPPRELDYNVNKEMPWRLQPEVAGGGGYFYDLAAHQLDFLQYLFGPIIEAEGYGQNMAGLYEVEDTFNACFRFANGLSGSASWCFVAHESARRDRISVVGTKGKLVFSVYDYEPIVLDTERGKENIIIENPPFVQKMLIEKVVEHLQGKGVCNCDSLSATTTNWVMDRILGKL